MRIKLIFAWYDFWIGFYYDRKNKYLYFFPIPMIGLKIGPKVPVNWENYHHLDCGVKYRGCHPTDCPKDVYERTGKWIGPW